MNRIETCMPLKSAFEVSYSFALDSENKRHVNIDKEALELTAADLKGFIQNQGAKHIWGLPNIPQLDKTEKIPEDPYSNWSDFMSNIMRDDVRESIYLVIYELIASAVNYCYWYGADNIRPNNSRSTEMYRLLDDSFIEAGISKRQNFDMRKIVSIFSRKLTQHRFPMLKERLLHLDQLINNRSFNNYTHEAEHISRADYCHGEIFAILLAQELTAEDVDPNLRTWMNMLVHWFPGFSEDIFLKRASLFFMMLNRRVGHFENEIKYLPIPADYHIPKVMRSLKVLKYSNELANKIENSELLIEGSLMECQIRAHTIVAGENIARIAGCSSTDVDDYLWSLKDKIDGKFHLTKTTNY